MIKLSLCTGYMIIDVGRVVLRLSVTKRRCSTDMVVI